MNVKKIGRPPVDPDVKRSEHVNLRLTRNEMDYVTELSLEQNKPKARIIRELIFGPDLDEEELKGGVE